MWLRLIVVLTTAAMVLPAGELSDDLLSREEAKALIVSYKGQLSGWRVASFPTLVSFSEIPLNSMDALSISEKCLQRWQGALDQLVEMGILTDYIHADNMLGIETRQLTKIGFLYFGPVYPKRFHSEVRIVPMLERAQITITGIRYFNDGRTVTVGFECPPCEVFSLLWKSGLFTGCGGRVDDSLVLENGNIFGHAHFKRKGGCWRVIQIELGPHAPGDG